ncbi:hypothetical protein HY523_01250 [Candidatus Berkelbacteria bacterium]|nr:hypothetical protein [Candidatus Berkelbacteria bacterium]
MADWVMPAYQWLRARLSKIEEPKHADFRLRWALLLTDIQRYILTAFYEWQEADRGSDGSFVNATSQTLGSQELPMTTKQVEREREDGLVRLGYAWNRIDTRAREVYLAAEREYQGLIAIFGKLAGQANGGSDKQGGPLQTKVARLGQELTAFADITEFDGLRRTFQQLSDPDDRSAPVAFREFLKCCRGWLDDVREANELAHEQGAAAAAAESARAAFEEQVMRLQLQLLELESSDGGTMATERVYQNGLVRLLRHRLTEIQAIQNELVTAQAEAERQSAELQSTLGHRQTEYNERAAGRQVFRERLVALLRTGQDASEEYATINNQLAVVNSLLAQLLPVITELEETIRRLAAQIGERQASIDRCSAVVLPFEQFISLLEAVLTRELFTGELTRWIDQAAPHLARITPETRETKVSYPDEQPEPLRDVYSVSGWSSLPLDIQEFLEENREILDDSRFYLLQSFEPKRRVRAQRWQERGYAEKFSEADLTLLVVLVQLVLTTEEWQPVISKLLRPTFPGLGQITGRIAWALVEHLQALGISPKTGMGLPELEVIVRHLKSVKEK